MGLMRAPVAGNGRQRWALAPVRRARGGPVPTRAGAALPNTRFHHYKGVHWMLAGGPMAEAYIPVVIRDDCQGCLVCGRTTEWFMEFARVAYRLTRINLRDCLHWGHLFDNPKPLIVPASNLLRCNVNALARLRDVYFGLTEVSRPLLERAWPGDRLLSQGERFHDRLTIVCRMVELWEDGQYIGWPS